MTKLRIEHAWLAAGWLALLPACSSDKPEAAHGQPGASTGNEAPPDATSGTPQAQSPTSGRGPLQIGSDAEIAHIVDSVDKAEIEQAQLAQSRAKNARVQSFAAQMIQDHTRSRNKLAELAQTGGFSPQPSDTSRTLEGTHVQTMHGLRNADAASFDQTYMSAQVQQHRDVLNMLTDQLIPAAKNADVKTQLVSTRSLVEHHLEEAMAIQRELANSAPTR
jgi:putative membrane protein